MKKLSVTWWVNHYILHIHTIELPVTVSILNSLYTFFVSKVLETLPSVGFCSVLQFTLICNRQDPPLGFVAPCSSQLSAHNICTRQKLVRAWEGANQGRISFHFLWITIYWQNDWRHSPSQSGRWAAIHFGDDICKGSCLVTGKPSCPFIASPTIVIKQLSHCYSEVRYIQAIGFQR